MGDQSNPPPPPPAKQKILIRPAEEKDVPALSTLASTTFAASFGYSMPAADLKTYISTAYSYSSFLSDLKNPLMDIFVAYPSEEDGGDGDRDGDQVIGFVQLTQGTTEPCLEGVEGLIELQRLYVDGNWHGRGVGSVLVGEVVRVAREGGWRNIWLGVWEENGKAQRVYERLGFRKVGEHDFVMGECVQTDWVMVKNLVAG